MSMIAESPYATPDDVAQLLGVELTTAQVSAANARLLMAQAAIDEYCNRGWRRGRVTEEFDGGMTLWLRHVPVERIVAVEVMDESGAWAELEDDYTPVVTADGEVGIVPNACFTRIRVTYEQQDCVPDAVKAACVAMAADNMAGVLVAPGMGAVERYELPDLKIQFGRGALTAGSNMAASPHLETLDRFRWRVVG